MMRRSSAGLAAALVGLVWLMLSASAAAGYQDLLIRGSRSGVSNVDCVGGRVVDVGGRVSLGWRHNTLAVLSKRARGELGWG
jgi:hypothetical protein